MSEIFQRYKKIILLAGFLLLTMLMTYGLYAVFFKSTAIPPTTTEPGITPTPGLPTAEPGGPQVIPEPTTPSQATTTATVVTPDNIARGGVTNVDLLDFNSSLDVTLASNGSDLQYYNKGDGKFYRVDSEGNLQTLDDTVFHNVENVTWSPQKSQAVLEYPDGSNIIYDFDNKKQISLPKHFEDFEYSAQGDSLIMKSMGLDVDNRWLVTANSDGSRIETLEPLYNSADSIIPSWSPNNQSVAMYMESLDFNRQEVYFVGLNGENFKSMVVNGRGFEHEWSPTGDRLLYSVYSSDTDYKPSVWLVNAQGDSIGSNRQNLQIETWAHKCTFANNIDVYCAVPTELESGSGMMPELAAETEDQLYKINTQTGTKQLIAVPNGSYNVSDIMISDNGYNLYFTDSLSGGIYKVKLK